VTLAGELQAAAQQMPPNIAIVRDKARALDTEVQALQTSVTRLQETADLVAASREDIMEVMQLSEKVQERTAKLEPLVAPLGDIFSCVAGGFEHFNWTALKEVAVGREPVSEWAEVFLKADRDGGGTLNVSEFEAIQWEMYNSSQVAFGPLDTDGSQELDATEWRQYHVTGVAVAEAQVDEDAALAQGESVQSLEASRADCRAFVQRHRYHMHHTYMCIPAHAALAHICPSRGTGIVGIRHGVHDSIPDMVYMTACGMHRSTCTPMRENTSFLACEVSVITQSTGPRHSDEQLTNATCISMDAGVTSSCASTCHASAN
jgi:hypothetical protein